ncbi:cytidine deaminase [Aurantiacibacter sp. MUD11]|uniref:cytidine deaminase n=1 Tax=Aurantiacibacter sp. MUD11 TaxID=3003265 RepID=UPI0022AB2A34|nr:cytidine deaminase [Aurantiacibacter sp. MUD11]WAT17731.1 cytidine deaminase [Aurantiacibacter sp. MUD11]
MSGKDALIAAALVARTRAYAPYSNFLVGCAVESMDGQIAVGGNVENACYRLGVCAEQSALSAAQVAYGLGRIRRIAIVGGPREGKDVGAVMPCGGCRQAIAEAGSVSGTDIEVICCDSEGQNAVSMTISELLPASFTLDTPDA